MSNKGTTKKTEPLPTPTEEYLFLNTVKQWFKEGIQSGSKSTSNLFDILITQNIVRAFSTGNQRDAIQFSLLFFVLLFSSIIIYYAGNSKTFLQNRVYTYGSLIVIPVLVFFYIATQMSMRTGSTILLGMFATGIAIALLLYAYSQMTATASLFFNFLIAIIVFFIVVIGLALVYNAFLNYLNKQEGTLGLIIQLIFFIPCLLIDLIKWCFYQFQITPNVIFVLFILEIAFLLLYFYLPKIMGYIMENKAKTVVLLGVAYLDHANTVYSTDQMIKLFKIPPPNPTYLLEKPPTNFNNFSLSMWIYINPQEFKPTFNLPSGTNAPYEYTIFNYNSVLDTSGGGLPKITFLYDVSNNNRETYNIYFTNSQNNSLGSTEDSSNLHDPEFKYGKYQMHLTNQRWNHFVFNYDRNICDLYINGYLERSMNLVNALPQINTYIDISNNNTSLQMTTGDNHGLYGAVCNIEYYTTPLNNIEIITKYNLLMSANPPIYNTGI